MQEEGIMQTVVKQNAYVPNGSVKKAMIAIQAFYCFINDINASMHGERKKFEAATIPKTKFSI